MMKALRLAELYHLPPLLCALLSIKGELNYYYYYYCATSSIFCPASYLRVLAGFVVRMFLSYINRDVRARRLPLLPCLSQHQSVR